MTVHRILARQYVSRDQRCSQIPEHLQKKRKTFLRISHWLSLPKPSPLALLKNQREKQLIPCMLVASRRFPPPPFSPAAAFPEARQSVVAHQALEAFANQKLYSKNSSSRISSAHLVQSDSHPSGLMQGYCIVSVSRVNCTLSQARNIAWRGWVRFGVESFPPLLSCVNRGIREATPPLLLRPRWQHLMSNCNLDGE